MSLRLNFVLMADYNQWMNGNLYAVADRLDPAARDQDRGAFFGSIAGTFNHILVADTVWLKRFAKQLSALESLDYVRQLPAPTALNAILFAEWPALAQARSRMDEVIIEFIAELNDETIELPISYKNSQGLPFTRKLGHLLQHFFNHQTHHRGQVTTLLSQAGLDVGVTDLLLRIPEV